jgi:mRNA-degrading endonuclease toxin of MazEF toxin-antitoxin module
MTIFNKGDLLLAEFPFAGGKLTKKRPALVLLDSGDADVVLARITTQAHQTAHDVNVVHWQTCGLRTASFIRLHKIVTAEKTQVLRVLGRLHPVDRQNVSIVLNRLFGNW